MREKCLCCSARLRPDIILCLLVQKSNRAKLRAGRVPLVRLGMELRRKVDPRQVLNNQGDATAVSQGVALQLGSNANICKPLCLHAWNT